MRIDFHLHYMVSDSRFAGERLRLMDEAEVALSVVHPLPHLSFMGEVCGDNDDVLCLVRQHPDRFVGSVYIDPRAADWQDTLHRFVGEGFRCVKMWPPIGFYPDDPAYQAVFEAIEELSLPVLFHVGLTDIGREYDSKYADPLRIEALLRRYPGIKVILAHWGGLGTWQMAWALMKTHANVLLDANAREWSWPGSELYRLYKATTPVDFDRVM